jgi:hypothetical protein
MGVGTFEIVVAVALGLLAAAALLSALGVLLAASLAVAMPAIAGLATPWRRRRWRDWHPPTEWVPAPDDTGRAEPAHAAGTPMRAVTLVSATDGDAQLRVIAAQLPSAQAGRPAYTPATLVHARLEPGSRLALPPDCGCDVLVFVLSGHGFVGGAQRRPVCGGQLVVLEADAPVVAAWDGNGRPAGLELLALGELPVHHPVARGETVVRDRAAQVDRRLQGVLAAADLHVGAASHATYDAPRRVRDPKPSVPQPRHAARVKRGAARTSVTSDA